MSFVINTTVDKNQELLDAYKELYEANANGKDVLLISKRSKIAVDSFALGNICCLKVDQASKQNSFFSFQ